jgi:hypothetical protein
LHHAIAWRILRQPMHKRGRFGLPMRLGVFLLVVLATGCATDRTGVSMVMVQGQDCPGPACENQIACGGPQQLPISSGGSVDLRALPASDGLVLTVLETETRSVGPPPVKPIWPSLAPLGSRSPPTV